MPDTVDADRSGLETLLNVAPQDLAPLKALFARATSRLGVDGAHLIERLDETGSWKQALGVDDLLMKALYGRAYNLLKIGQWERAKGIFSVLCALEGREADYWLGYGICLNRCREKALALSAFDMCARLAPEMAAPHLYRLDLFMHQERWDEARSALARFDQAFSDRDDPGLLRAVEPFRRALDLRAS